LSDAIAALAAYDQDGGDLLCVVETPKGGRNKSAATGSCASSS
jgi:hypothetical protein